MVDEQRIVVDDLLVVDDGYAVQQDQRVPLAEGETAVGGVGADLQHAVPVHAPYAQFADEFDEEFLHDREPGVILEVVACAVALVENAVLTDGQGLIERVGIEVPLQLHPELAKLQCGSRCGAEPHRRDLSGVQVQEGAEEVQVADVVLVHILDFQEHVLIPIYIGREEDGVAVLVNGFRVEVLAAARGGDEGIFVLRGPASCLVGAGNARADDFPFVFRDHVVRESAGGGEPFQGGGEVRNPLASGAGDAVVMEDTQAETGFPGAAVGDGDAGGAGSRGAARRSDLKITGCRGRDGDRELGNNLHAAFDAVGAERVHHGDRPGAGLGVKSFFGGAEPGVSEQPVIAGGQGVGQHESSCPAAAVQGDLCRLDHAGGRMDLHIGDAAEIGQAPADGIHAPGGHPDGVAGHVDFTVCRDEDPLAQALRSGKGGNGQQGQEKEYGKEFSHRDTVIRASRPVCRESRRSCGSRCTVREPR